MTVFYALGLGYVVLATCLFTAQVLIAAGYALTVGVRTLWRYLKAGEQLEARTREMVEGR